MFTSILSQDTQTKLLEKHHGVDLASYQCHELQNSAIYSKYPKEQLHYVIDSVQKGQKAPTQIGLKRLIKKNRAKAFKKKLNSNSIPELNPKAPEEICLKALRTEFRTKLENNHMPEEQQKKPRSAALVKRKEHQRQRRNELIRLVKKYIEHLQPHFGARLHGYGRCPKVSRQQIKDYLKTLGIQAKLDPVVIKQGDYKGKERREVRSRGRGRGRQINRFPKMPRGMPNPNTVFGSIPSLGQNPMGHMPFWPGICPMSRQQIVDNLKNGMWPSYGYQTIGMLLNGMSPFGVNAPLGMMNVAPQIGEQNPKTKLEFTIRDKEKFLKMQANTVRRLVLRSLKYAIEQAGIPQAEVNIISEKILKEEITQIFKCLESPAEIKKRAGK